VLRFGVARCDHEQIILPVHSLLHYRQRIPVVL